MTQDNHKLTRPQQDIISWLCEALDTALEFQGKAFLLRDFGGAEEWLTTIRGIEGRLALELYRLRQEEKS